MMRKHKWRIILLILVVVLLSIISSRVSPSLPTPEAPSISKPDDSTNIPEGPSVPDDLTPPEAIPPSEEPQVPEEPQIELPDVSVHEWNLKLVNNRNILSQSFAPDVTEFIPGQYFDSRAIDALNAFLDGAAKNGFTTYVSTAYRPFSTQAYIFYGKASQIAWGGEVEYDEAEILARELVAYPGTSEHQLGLAADIVDSSNTLLVAEDVEEMPLLLWMKEHCHEYGFILRYPKDKQEITGWYEPWHFRYVGIEAASFIMENNLCLEEFVELYQLP